MNKNDECILRKANKKDCCFIWELANDPQVRAVSFSSAEISWEEHQKWFNSGLEDANCLLYVAETPTLEKMGQIRFELKNEGWVISLSIVEEFRGHGFGFDMIKTGSQLLFDTYSGIRKIHAYIKNENSASIHVFEKSGYTKMGKASLNTENDAVLMVLDKSGTGNR